LPFSLIRISFHAAAFICQQDAQRFDALLAVFNPSRQSRTASAKKKII